MSLRRACSLVAITLFAVAAVSAQNTALTGYNNPGRFVDEVFYLDMNNNVQEIIDRGSGLGDGGPILLSPSPTQESGAIPDAGGSAVTGLVDSFGTAHVFYVDQTLNVHELYNPSSAEVDQWFHNQLTQGAAGAPPVQDVEGQLSSCFDSHNIEHVFYIAENNHVEELYFYNGRWWNNDLSAKTGTPGAILPSGTGALHDDYGSGLTSFCDNSGNANVFYTAYFEGSDALHINLLQFNGSKWSNTDVTAAGGGPPAAAANALTSFQDSFGIRHVFYFAFDNNVQELYEVNTNGPWSSNDLTLRTNTPGAYFLSGITSFFDSSYIEHVFFIDANNHVRELYNNGQWQTNDLSALTASPITARGGSLTSFFDSLGEHVYYVGYSDTNYGDMVELFYSGGTWKSLDMTSYIESTGVVPPTAIP